MFLIISLARNGKAYYGVDDIINKARMRIKTLALGILLLVCVFFNTGCMAIAIIVNEEMNGPSDSPRTITITSNPSGANVMKYYGWGQTKKIGETPLTLDIDPSGMTQGYNAYPLISLEKEGYKSKLVHLYKVNEIISLDNFACTLDIILIAPVILDQVILLTYAGIKGIIGKTPVKGRHFVYDNQIVELVPSPQKRKSKYYIDNQDSISSDQNKISLTPEEIQQQIIIQQTINANNQQMLQNIQQQNQQFNTQIRNMTNQNQQNSLPLEHMNPMVQSPQPSSMQRRQPCYCGNGKCKICGGSGIQPGSTLGKNGQTKCRTCHGTGKCIVCNGRGER